MAVEDVDGSEEARRIRSLLGGYHELVIRAAGSGTPLVRGSEFARSMTSHEVTATLRARDELASIPSPVIIRRELHEGADELTELGNCLLAILTGEDA